MRRFVLIEAADNVLTVCPEKVIVSNNPPVFLKDS